MLRHTTHRHSLARSPNRRFLQYTESVEIDWEAIQAKKQQEKDDERARSGNLSSSGK